MAGAQWFLDDEPSARFPVYCRGNVGEVVPRPATPMAATITTPAFRHGFDDLFGRTGAFTAAELDGGATTGGVFGGYLYLNLSFARSFAARAPGMRVADVDAQLFGSSGDAPPFAAGPGDRSPRSMARAGVGLVRMILSRTPPDLDGERAAVARWVAAIPAAPTDAELVALAQEFTDLFGRYLVSLLEASFGAAIPTAVLDRLCASAERKEPGLLVKAMSGLGTIETAAPAVALWRLGRMVAADPALTSAFDQGVSGAVERLRFLGTDEATSFLEAFDDFLDRFGHRGPNEVELASSTWGTAPDTALAVVERLRLTAAAADPEVAARRLGEERRAARERLLHAVLPPLRPVVRRMLDTGARGTARREQAKGTLVLGIHGLRVALVTAADRLVAAGSLPDRTALFMATVDELSTLLSDPESLRDELADRRARYEDLDARVPPFSFVGRIPPPATWPLRSARLAGQRPLSYSGIGVSGGIARGRARVVIDPSDPRGIEPGEVLVAPLTDPAWTPLFLAAAAVVVDVGAMQSHAAIVARELGVPAVVSVEGASGSIADGDLLEVDGNRGLVTVLEETGGASAAPPRSGAPGGAGARP